MDPRQGSSSRRGSSSTGAGPDNKHREVMWEHPSLDAVAAVPSYCLFLEETVCDKGVFQLQELFSVDYRHQQPKLEIDPKVTTAVQSRLPIESRSQLPTFYHGGIHASSLAMVAQDTGFNAQGQMGPAENLVLLPPVPVSGDQVSGAVGSSEQDLKQDAPLSQDGKKRYEHLIGVQVAYFRVCLDPTVATSGRLLQQAIQDLKNHCAFDALVAHYENNTAEADTTIIRQQSTHTADSSQVQQDHRATGFNNMVPPVHQQETVAPPVVNPTLRLMDIKGKVAASCSDCKGSRFVQQAIEVATPEEIVMVYREIMPCVRMLAVDMFGNHAVQKILEHGPRSCKREVISNLIGHILPLSLDKFSCRVIQKAFEVGDHDQKVVMAKELSTKLLKCVRDQFANHVIQKCIECLPPEDIHFILRSLDGRAKALSLHPYGCHVIQKVLTRCKGQEIYHTLTEEIMQNVTKLSTDKFGNYVVQQLVEHGDHAMVSRMVRTFAGRVVSMSYHKFASNVVEKCLAFGSQEDRRLITDEIIDAGGGQHFDHLVDMMINPYANFVIQKMVVTAEELQVALLLDVASSNATSLARYTHGRHVIDSMEKFLSAPQGCPPIDPARCCR